MKSLACGRYNECQEFAHKEIVLQAPPRLPTPTKMPGPSNTLLIEGSFEELSDELAHYIDEVQKKQSPDSANTQSEIAPLLEKAQRDEILKKLVTASEVLNTAPEKGMQY